MRIVFFGTPHFVIPVLESLLKHFTVVAVITAPDQKAGRKQLITPSPVKKFITADSVSTPVLSPQTFDEDTKKQLRAMQPDLFVVAAYGKILPEDVLFIPPFGAINVHPSLLPKYRGPTPVQTALLNGDTTTGVTIIKMDKEMDHGPILAMNSYSVHETDTTETLLTHLFNLSAEMLPDILTNFTNGKIIPEAQDESKATYSQKIVKDDGRIDLENPPEKRKLGNMIRAYYPWPTVWTKIDMKNPSSSASKQELRIKLLPNNKVQMEGKNPVSLKDFVNGYPEMKELLEKII
jgi:methionyl-tRNA formyltransferase